MKKTSNTRPENAIKWTTQTHFYQTQYILKVHTINTTSQVSQQFHTIML